VRLNELRLKDHAAAAATKAAQAATTAKQAASSAAHAASSKAHAAAEAVGEAVSNPVNPAGVQA